MYYGGYGWGWGFFDPTYILIIIGVLISAIASANVNRTFRRYQKEICRLGLTGAEAAERVLHMAGIFDVQVLHISGNLTDHYDPRNKTLSLSDSVYASRSIAAVGVAAHECGHAVQDHVGYFPLRFRGWLVPVANFGASISWPLILIGLFLGYGAQSTSAGSVAGILIDVGIWCFSLAVLFQIVTLPVEFNASRRALRMIRDGHLLERDELAKTRRVLVAAALTYVAGTLSAILQLLRILLLTRDDRR